MKYLLAFSVLKEYSSFACVDSGSRLKEYLSNKELTEFHTQSFTGCLEFSLHDLGAPPNLIRQVNYAK